MAAERTATCPKCGDERTTKAQPRTTIACFGCGESYRAPAIEQGAPVATPEPSPAPAARTVDKPGPKVARATATKLPQRARPRARGADGKLQSAPMPDTPPPPPPPRQEEAKRHGAKGGRGFYLERVGRGG